MNREFEIEEEPKEVCIDPQTSAFLMPSSNDMSAMMDASESLEGGYGAVLAACPPLHYLLPQPPPPAPRGASHTPQTCNICEKTFKNYHTLYLHRQRVHAAPASVDCADCGRAFKNKHYLYMHRLNKHYSEERRVRCEPCASDFRTERALLMHTRKYHQDGALPEKTDENNVSRCALCPLELGSPEELSAHVAAAHRGQYACPKCSKVFGSLVNVKSHLRYVHLPCPERHPCLLCPTVFKKKHHLKRHQMNVHEAEGGARAYACPLPGCARAFRSAAYLLEHTRRHTRAGAAPCRLCDKAFATQGQLNKHVKVVHPAGEAEACATCGKRFKSAAHAARHARTVHEARSEALPCARCGKTFANKRYLASHLARHAQREAKAAARAAAPRAEGGGAGKRRGRRRKPEGPTEAEAAEVARLRELNFIKCEPIEYPPSDSE